MSENKYTPEPWRAFNNGEGVVGVGTDHSDVCWTRIEEGGWLDSDRTIDIDYENARRIVACVNACAGISTENLEDNLPVQELARRYNKALKQRDELLAALEFYAEGHHFILHDANAWETVSGEPQNFQEDEANTATVEDGSVAKAAIASVKENSDVCTD